MTADTPRPDAKDHGGPLDMPGGDNGRPGESKDRPYGFLSEGDNDKAAPNGKSPLADARSPGGTAGTMDVTETQDREEGN